MEVSTRQDFVQHLLDHNVALLRQIPPVTSEESKSRQAELDAADSAARLRRVLEGPVSARMILEQSLQERITLLTGLRNTLQIIDSPPEDIPDEELGRLIASERGSWPMLGRIHADNNWILALEIWRSANMNEGDELPAGSLEVDVANCGFVTQSIIQIAIDQSFAESP